MTEYAVRIALKVATAGGEDRFVHWNCLRQFVEGVMKNERGASARAELRRRSRGEQRKEEEKQGALLK